MKKKLIALAVPVLLSYGTFTFAATKGLDHDDFKAVGTISASHEQASKDDDNHEFDDRLGNLLKNHPDNRNVFVRLCKKDEDHHPSHGHHGNGHDQGNGHDHGHDGDHDNGDHDNPSGGGPSGVPVPAAVWLFGSGMIGLLGFGRKKV